MPLQGHSGFQLLPCSQMTILNNENQNEQTKNFLLLPLAENTNAYQLMQVEVQTDHQAHHSFKQPNSETTQR
jgi:hypothetical protein